MTETKRWINSSHLSKFPQEYQLVAEVIGFDSMLKLAESYQGQGIYFPRLNKVFQSIRDELIMQEFTGGNHRELAAKYGVTERWVYQIIKKRKEERTNDYQ